MKHNTSRSAIKNRRSIYAIDDKINQSTKDIKQLVDFAVMHVPSAFNNQSTRTVLLVGAEHHKLWDMTKDILRKIVPADSFVDTENKIDQSFRAGYGTVLFFIDESVNKKSQAQFPSYADNFPIWANHSSGMHQFAVWIMLEELGLGASLQHYNPLIDQAVREEWKLDANWTLVAQMPFGRPIVPAGAKEFAPIETRSLLFE